MNESLFQFIWQYSLFYPSGLHTTAGEPITIIHPGKLNRDAGPDFYEARIKIGNTTLIGNIELHLATSDWVKHGHENDFAYKNLILHVVYKNDIEEISEHFPVLEMNQFIAPHVIALYMDLAESGRKLPCAGLHMGVKHIIKENWLSSLLAERWEQKLSEWDIVLQNSVEDWRNLLYWRMAANFGFKINSTPFLMLAQSLPINITAKHRENILQIEALLFGQAGMLGTTYEDEYPNELQKEYNYLKIKYKLKPIPVHLWRFLRMRPANFPTIRIAQFAALLQKSVHLFSKIIDTRSVRDIIPLLDVSASEYWDTHFKFDDATQKNPTTKKLGLVSIENIVINTIAPIQFHYASKQDSYELLDESLKLLETVPAEKNSIISKWEENGWRACNASQSQSLIQLYNNYCSKKRCLECAVGASILKSS